MRKNNERKSERIKRKKKKKKKGGGGERVEACRRGEKYYGRNPVPVFSNLRFSAGFSFCIAIASSMCR